MQHAHQPSTALSDATPDAELALRAAQGDASAFERIMRRHNRLLFRTVISFLIRSLRLSVSLHLVKNFPKST